MCSRNFWTTRRRLRASMIQIIEYFIDSKKAARSTLTFLILKAMREKNWLEAMMTAINGLVLSLNFLIDLWLIWRNLWNSKIVAITIEKRKLKLTDERSIDEEVNLTCMQKTSQKRMKLKKLKIYCRRQYEGSRKTFAVRQEAVNDKSK